MEVSRARTNRKLTTQTLYGCHRILTKYRYDPHTQSYPTRKHIPPYSYDETAEIVFFHMTMHQGVSLKKLAVADGTPVVQGSIFPIYDIPQVMEFVIYVR